MCFVNYFSAQISYYLLKNITHIHDDEWKCWKNFSKMNSSEEHNNANTKIFLDVWLSYSSSLITHPDVEYDFGFLFPCLHFDFNFEMKKSNSKQ